MKEALLTFIKAVFWGSVVGGGPFLLLTIPVAIAEGSLYELGFTLWLAVLPMVFAGALVLPSSVLLGLPLTALLAWTKAERATTYTLAGAGLGMLLSIVIVVLEDGWIAGALFLAVLGAAAGATTGAIWGQWRDRLASRSKLPPESA